MKPPAGSRPADEGQEPSVLESTKRLLRLLARMNTPGVRARIAIALALTVVAKVISVGAPLVLADGVNGLAEGAGVGLTLFVGLIGVWASLRFAAAAGPYLRDALFMPVSAQAQRETGVAVFAHVQSLSLRFHQTKRTGGLHRVIERGVGSIDFLLRFLAFNIAPTFLELGLAAALLAWQYGPGFAAIAAGTVAVYTWLTFAITRWRLKFRREMNERDTEASGRSVDALLNFETVKSFAAEARETARYDTAVASYAKASVRANTSLIVLNIAQAAIMNIGLAAMVALAGAQVLSGQMGPGDIAAVILIMMNLYQPLNILGFAYREVRQASIDMEKMFALLDEKPDIADAPDAVTLRAGPGEINFDRVSFAHEGRAAGLEDVSFHVPAGSTTAIVGASGAGKSTLLKLLFRFYDPDAGAVRIDGQDIARATQASVRNALGVVPQDVVLFNDTIRYNIAYGRPDATEEALREAARQAQLLAFIEGLPDGWDTRVGERGLKLSGGEKQRVGLARVLIKNPRILVLDEATSSLDSITEADVQAALDAAARGRTTIVVAHRLSTIRSADQILVLKAGRVVERGTHAHLVARGGEYADLWRRQAEEAPGASPQLAVETFA